MGGDVCSCLLWVGVFGVELWMLVMCVEIECWLGIIVLDIYGLLEVMGLGVVMECLEIVDGLIIWEDYFFLEIVNLDDGMLLEDGEYGELLFIILIKEVLLVICYCICDLMCLLLGIVWIMCCMDCISGCSDDMLIICGVNVFFLQLEEEIFKFEYLVLYYQLEVNCCGYLDLLVVCVELKESGLVLSYE